jgi:hypothetical protein
MVRGDALQMLRLWSTEWSDELEGMQEFVSVTKFIEGFLERVEERYVG